MNLYYFDPKTFRCELVRENIDELNTKAAIVDFFYENSFDEEIGNILSIVRFQISDYFFYQTKCEKSIIYFVKSNECLNNSYRDKLTITTITGEEYEI